MHFILGEEIQIYIGLGLLYYILLVPAVEELAFRGILQHLLMKKLTGQQLISRANIITSVVFTALHIILSSNPYAVLVFFPSILFGIVYEKYRSVIPCFLLHSTYNLNILFY